MSEANKLERLVSQQEDIMKRVYKYTLLPGKDTYALPAGAKILYAREQGADLCMWVEIEIIEGATTVTEFRKIIVVGTGHNLPEDDLKYIGSGHLENGSLIFHAYEVLVANTPC